MRLRLDKFMSNLGVGTRSEVKKQIGFGNLKVNGKVIRKPETKIDTELDKVEYKKEILTFEELVYYVLHKPQGVITATEDKTQKTVMDLLEDKRKGLAPVGRLDKDTEGLLLITNDGDLAHRLLSPKKHIDKTYYAKIKGELPEDAEVQFEDGIRIDANTLTLPAKLQILGKDGEMSEVEVTVREGKFHQIKRMFLKLGCEVVYLRRIRMGGLHLDALHLDVGEYRRLTKEEWMKLSEMESDAKE